MPTLDWIGKEKVVNHHKAVPFWVLERPMQKLNQRLRKGSKYDILFLVPVDDRILCQNNLWCSTAQEEKKHGKQNSAICGT